MVDDRPFIILGGELHNSSSSSLSYMEPIWGKLRELHCNTALAAVSWELIEPEEGKFDFTLVDGLLEGARKHGLRLVLLWFGSWKNGTSSYAPAWVKLNLERFPRMRLRSGETTRTLSCFSEEACNADAAAFAMLMRHLRQVDGEEHTVLLVQVENEVGLKGAARDYAPEADAQFHAPVPAQLVRHLTTRTDTVPMLATTRAEAHWKERFGPVAEETFMAWHMARYIEHVAEAGRKEYALPLYVNAWTVQHKGDLPGVYPSGGPVAHMLEVWRCAAPTLDLFAPDIYLPDFPAECALYARPGNPLLIPEARRDRWAPANVFYAIGQHDAIGFAPFGVESIGSKQAPPIGQAVQEVLMDMEHTEVGDMLSNCYRLLGDMIPVLTDYYGTDTMTGVLQTGSDVQNVRLGDYVLRVKFHSQGEFPGAGILIADSPSSFIIAGHGFRVEFQPLPGMLPHVDFLSIEEGNYSAGVWISGRRLNGDEGIVHLGETPSVIKASLYSYA